MRSKSNFNPKKQFFTTDVRKKFWGIFLSRIKSEDFRVVPR